MVTTPPLAEHLRDDPAALGERVRFIAKRIAPEDDVQLTHEILQWIREHLPADYHWPGNIRELEQCARNIMIRNHYQPTLPAATADHGEAQHLAQQIEQLALTADQLLTRYAQIACARTGSFKLAAQRLGIDRRTVRARVADSSPPVGGQYRHARNIPHIAQKTNNRT